MFWIHEEMCKLKICIWPPVRPLYSRNHPPTLPLHHHHHHNAPSPDVKQMSKVNFSQNFELTCLKLFSVALGRDKPVIP